MLDLIYWPSPALLDDEELDKHVTFFSDLTGYLATQPETEVCKRLGRFAAGRWELYDLERARRKE